jgi:hypothetical protein
MEARVVLERGANSGNKLVFCLADIEGAEVNASLSF